MSTLSASSTRTITADADAVSLAVRVLADGGLVAFPTETVYGLGADARNGAAVARLFAAKGRPRFNPLIVHVCDEAAARRLGHFDATAARLAAAFWPGPLTLVVPKALDCPVAELATTGLATVALRVPAQPVARDLLAQFDRPIVAPSANRSGHVSPTTAAHVRADLAGRIDLILDGGPCPVGVESTVVACLGEPMLLRPGGLARVELERALGRALAAAAPMPAGSAEAPLAPGQLASHYAPRTPVRLEAHDVRPGEALLAFGADLPPGADQAACVLNLSARGDLVEAAANLFAHLRALDQSGGASIAVMPVPQYGLGEAINDRLQRAAAEG